MNGIEIGFYVLAVVLAMVGATSWAKGEKLRKEAEATKTAVLVENAKLNQHLSDSMNGWGGNIENMSRMMYETVNALDKCNELLIRAEAREILRNENMEEIIRQMQNTDLGGSETAAICEKKRDV